MWVDYYCNITFILFYFSEINWVEIMYLVIGGGGFLGGYLIKNIINSTKEKILASYHSSKGIENTDRVEWFHLNLTDSNSLKELACTLELYKERGEKITCIYTAGYIKPDDCLKNPELAVKNNIIALLDFLKESKNFLDSLVFTSTDFVFDTNETGKPYSEEDKENPINFYGSIKLACEKIVNSHGYYVVRLPFMFGRSLNPHKSHFIEHLERVLNERERFEILSDYYENSLDYDTVSKIILELLIKFKGQLPAPLIHVCSDEPVTKYEIAIAFARKYHLDSSYLQPIPLSECSFFLAKRGTIKMDNSLVKSLLGISQINFKV